MDGFEVLRRLRERDHDLPVLFLTARDDVKDKVQGLTVGGDDYITKPFSLEEVVARIRAVLRRTSPEETESAVLRYADLEMNEDSYEVTRAGRPVELSPTEFKLLRYLIINAERVVSKSQILDHVWDYNWQGVISIVESYISYLRRKIDSPEALGITDPEEARNLVPLIHTRRGIGYVLRASK
ncbi:response regulator transcription factor, partial [Actinotignum timonense]|uniref:response regulator transcription factor n=1 Tax=Actinotignum timonense TaxID=1870995 RepID=UPI002A81FA08